MKLPFLLFALALSAQGWCASSIPSGRITRSVIPIHQAIGSEKPQEEIMNSLRDGKLRIAMIGCLLITYLTTIIWWAIATRSSLDNILKEVLQSIAQYS